MQESLAEKEEKAKKYDKFLEGLETFEKEHPEQAAAFREEVKYILDYPDQNRIFPWMTHLGKGAKKNVSF